MMNRHVFFMIMACLVTGAAPFIFAMRNSMLTFVAVALAALFIQVYWRDVIVHGLIVRGRYAIREGNIEKLRQTYQKIYRLTPNSFAGKMAQGVIYSLQGNWGHAEKFFRQALYLKPGNLYVCLNLAVVLLRRERYHETVKLLQSLIYAYPQCVVAYKTLAQAFYCLGEPHDARNCLLKARLIDGHDTEIESFLRRIEQEIEDAA